MHFRVEKNNSFVTAFDWHLKTQVQYKDNPQSQGVQGLSCGCEALPGESLADTHPCRDSALGVKAQSNLSASLLAVQPSPMRLGGGAGTSVNGTRLRRGSRCVLVMPWLTCFSCVSTPPGALISLH